MNTKPIYEKENVLHLNTAVSAGDLVDQIARRVCQLRAMAAVMAETDMGLVPDDALNGIGWAFRDGLAEIHTCADTLGELAYKPTAMKAI